MVTLTNDYFFINGVRCDTVGLSCDTPPIPAMAVQNYTEWVTGKDTPNATPDGTYNNVQYTLTAYVFLDSTPHDTAAIYSYFANARTLTISRLTGYYYKIQKVNSITPTVKYDGKSIVYKISLTLAPFKYYIDNTETTVTGGSITNPGTRYSRPIYKITGRASGNTTTKLTVNGQQLTLSDLTDASTTIYIDTERMLIYDQANTNLMEKSSGILPFLAPGVNTAAVTAGTLAITGNWRSY